MNSRPGFDSPPTLDELFGKQEREWLRMGGYSNQEKHDVDELTRRHQEALGAAILSQKSLAVLLKLNQETFILSQSLEEMAGGYADWRAIFNVVGAGWAHAGEDGIIITQQGKDAAGKVFRPQNHSE